MRIQRGRFQAAGVQSPPLFGREAPRVRIFQSKRFTETLSTRYAFEQRLIYPSSFIPFEQNRSKNRKFCLVALLARITAPPVPSKLATKPPKCPEQTCLDIMLKLRFKFQVPQCLILGPALRSAKSPPLSVLVNKRLLIAKQSAILI
jgi:hypothetical protein